MIVKDSINTNNIIKHHPNQKTFLLGKKRLERKYNYLNRNQLNIKRKNKQKVSPGFRKIMVSIRLYKKLLNSKDTIFTSKLPYKVSLPEFFSFSPYIKHSYGKQIEGIGSWYGELCRGEEYCLRRYGKFNILEKKLILKYPTKDEELVSKAVQVYLEFYNKIKSKLTLPNDTDAEFPARFIKYLFKFIDHKFKSRKFKLYIILNKKFLDIEFSEYLQDMDWLK